MATLLLLLTLPASAVENFVPISVWYGGGKARAPMLERDPRAKKELWRADLKQIKSLGFNTIRTWIDWASAEPKEGEFNFDTLDVLADLAQEEGLRMMVQVYSETAPDCGHERLVFIFNHADSAKTANFTLALRGRARDVETGAAVDAISEGGRLRISRELPANGVAVLAVR